MGRLELEPGDAIEICLLCGGEVASKCWSTAKSKLGWRMDLEKKIFRDRWYDSEPFTNAMEEEYSIILGYLEWNHLTFQSTKKDVVGMKPALSLSKMTEKSEFCKELGLTLVRSDVPARGIKISLYEYPSITSWTEEFPILLYKEEKKVLDGRRMDLTLLPNLGRKRKTRLLEKGVRNILDLISTPPSELTKIEGISDLLVRNWTMAASKVLEPRSNMAIARVFSAEPRTRIIFSNDTTKVEIVTPHYGQFFVRGHPQVESAVLESLHEHFGMFYNISMQRENVIKLTKKDQTQEIKIYGPWVIEALGFENKKDVDQILEGVSSTISGAYHLWDEKDVTLLIEAQKEFIDADQVLTNLTKKFSLEYSSIEDILEKDGTLVVDTNVIIDGRLSFLFVGAMQGTFGYEYTAQKREIIIPNIVAFEIKSMSDRYKPKKNEFYFGNLELLRLKALHDAGYISLKHLGEVPLFPPIAQYEKERWRFLSSLRDEYILKVLEEAPNSVLVTSDGRVAASAYIRGHDVVLLKPLIKGVREKLREKGVRYRELSKEEKDRIVRDLGIEIGAARERIIKLIMARE